MAIKEKKIQGLTSPSHFLLNASPTLILITFNYILLSSLLPLTQLFNLPVSPFSLHSSFHCSHPPTSLWDEDCQQGHISDTVHRGLHTHTHTRIYPICVIVFTNGAAGMRGMGDGVGWALLSPSDRLYKTVTKTFLRHKSITLRKIL